MALIEMGKVGCKNLRDIGNTVLVVKHDPKMMREADIHVDMSPKAGTPEEIIKVTGSYTGIYLREYL